MPPQMGPPLPRSMDIFWPWYKVEEIPPEVPPEEIPEVPPPPAGYYSLYLYIVGKGSVTPGSGNYPAGSTVTLTALPGSGYVFDRWAGDVSGTSPMVNINMSRTRTATAYFKAEEYPPAPPEEPPEEPPEAPPGVPKIPASDIANPEFEAVKGTYDLGGKVPYEMAFDYKGKGQGGSLTISLGTGLIGTFFTKHTFSPVGVSFEEAFDWRALQLSGTFTIPPTLERGQTYSVRATLKTDDGAQEIDTDWTVFTIAGLPGVEPPPAPPAEPLPPFVAEAVGPNCLIQMLGPGNVKAGSEFTLYVAIMNWNFRTGLPIKDFTVYGQPVFTIDGRIDEGAYRAITPVAPTWKMTEYGLFYEGQYELRLTMPTSPMNIKVDSWIEQETFNIPWHKDATLSKRIPLG